MKIKKVFVTVMAFVCSSVAFAFGTYDPDYTGHNVAIHKNIAAVGSTPHDRFGGYLQILERRNDRWELLQTINLRDDNPVYRVPVAMAMDENRIVMGADVVRGAPGAVVVYKRNQNEWKKTADIHSSDRKPDDLFGFSLDMYGNEFIVGAEDYTGTDDLYGSGRVFVFDASTVRARQILNPNQITAYRGLGTSVSLRNDTLVISGPGMISLNTTKQEPATSYGSVFVYAKENGVWKETTRLHELPFFNEQVYRAFGELVCTANNTIFVTNNSNILIFEKKDEWEFIGLLDKPERTYTEYSSAGTIFAMTASNDFFVFGSSPTYPSVSHMGDNAVFVYQKVNGVWVLRERIRSIDLFNDKPLLFGYSVALYEDRLIIGALGNMPASPRIEYEESFPGKAHIVQLLPDKGYRLEATIGFHEGKNIFGFRKRVPYVENY